MGMWTKDVLYGGLRLDENVQIGASAETAEQVLLLDIGVISDEVPTPIGMATKTELIVCKLTHDGTRAQEPLRVNTLARAIGDKAREKADGDLPAVVCFFTTAAGTEGWSDATVMQFVRRWDGKVPEFKPVEDNPLLAV